MCAAWWESLARKNAETGKGNATLTVFGLKNMAPDDWAERIEHTGAGGGPITVAAVDLTDDELAAIAAGRRS